MSKHQMAMLILAVLGWSAVAVFEWIPRYPAVSVVRMPADGSAPPLPPAIEVGPGHIGSRR
jgi:hypothetical protein